MPSPLVPKLRLAPAHVDIEHRDDGSMVIRSKQVLDASVRCVGDWLHHWADAAPDQTFIAERSGQGWRRCSYAEALDAALRIGQALVDRGLGAASPIVVLSENSVDHALLALGAGYAGVPLVPISTAYSLLSSDHAKLRDIVQQVKPGMVFAADRERYAKALKAIDMPATPLADLLAATPGEGIRRAHAEISPDHMLKILYTSGSTGSPKGVINTHRMVAANQQQVRQIWPFLEDTPPVVLDWLPWSHTFGGNFNFHMVLSNGGTLYIDDGKPMPDLVGRTVSNLKEVSPTMYFNVPRGFDLLMPYLKSDETLRRSFFRRCELVFYAAASLPQHLWEDFERLAQQERNGDMALVSAWGATETAPMATAVHYAGGTAGIVGLPVPGCEIKLVPSAGKYEARVKGPNVTPGYWQQSALTAKAFDDEGFYRIGDALRMADVSSPSLGLVFDGRVAEDFKLVTGTWVHVGAVRLRLLEASKGLIQDAVITGHDRHEIGALLFLNPAQRVALSDHDLRQRLSDVLAELGQEPGQGSSLRIVRALVQDEAPSLDAGEINDKSYVNQRAVLARRSEQVQRLYAEPRDAAVITLPAS